MQTSTSSPTPSDRHHRLMADLSAALTVTLVGIPQCLAYAMMSGLPPAYGLATAAIPGFIAALAGKSPHIVTGPTNTTGLLILAAMGPWLGADGFVTEAGLGALATLVLLAGIIRLAAAGIGGAALIRFLPESVLAGFTAGAGLLIVVMQLDEAFGFKPIADSGLFGEFSGLWAQLQAGARPALPTVLVTVGTAVAIALGKKWAPKLPMALITVVGAAGLAALFGAGVESGLSLVSDRSAVPNAWPPGALPDLDPQLLRSMFVPAAAIALLGTLELAVSARADGARPDMTRELGAQGVANVVGAFTSSFPASASLTRSALLRLGNAQTRLAPAMAALFTIPILLFAGSAVGWIPQASLAGVLLITAIRMINVPRLRRMWAGAPAIRILLTATFISTLVLPLEWAVIIGAAGGLAIHLRRTSRPRIRLLRPGARGLVPVSRPVPADCDELVIEVSGDLYYAAVDHFRDAVGALTRRPRHIVVDVSHAHEMRYAALQALEGLRTDVEESGGELVVAGVDARFEALAQRTNSPLRLVPDEPTPGACVRRCLENVRTAEGRPSEQPMGAAAVSAPPNHLTPEASPMSSLLFRQLFDRDTCTYTYLLADPETREAILIDPVAELVDRDAGILQELNLTLKYTVETHVHADHVTGGGALRDRLGSQTIVGNKAGADCADITVGTGDRIEFGAFALEARATPGHTSGCTSYVTVETPATSDAPRMVFTGDALLIRGCGRTDFQQGDSATLYQSVHEQLFSLPDDTLVYPGHDYKGRTVTTVGEEKAHNPRLGGGNTVDDFVGIMDNLKLPHPKRIDVALPANLACGTRQPDQEQAALWAPLEVRQDGVPEVRASWLATAHDVRVIDVRQPEEFTGPLGHIPDAENVPLEFLGDAAIDWDRDQPIILACRSGGRSASACLSMMALGFNHVASLRGGMKMWNELGISGGRVG